MCRYELFHPISSELTFLFNLFKIQGEDFWLQKRRQAIRYGLDQTCYILTCFAHWFSMCIYGQWWFICSHSCCLVAKLCPTLCNPMDYSLPGSPVHGIFQARMLEWVAISFSTGSSWPRDQTHGSYIGRQTLYCWEARNIYSTTREAHSTNLGQHNKRL